MVTFAQELIESRRLAEQALANGESGPSTRSRSRNRDGDQNEEIEVYNQNEDDPIEGIEEDNGDDPKNDFNDEELEYVEEEEERKLNKTDNIPIPPYGRLRQPRDSPDEIERPKGLAMINVERDLRQGTDHDQSFILHIYILSSFLRSFPPFQRHNSKDITYPSPNSTSYPLYNSTSFRTPYQLL
ncbi:uncharacterized protein MELLADRAFT_65245 [Melampsora larici-populina 98AG31]|uniref:Uncharacterized protein n=1 Tax=Melampsora larici-populina (strain 98AG31 / pathotype 3-4-7) TaxID=747676 RepID=F4RUK8_MELLP|nr:uncharacterized protein MELLADRAFT_65245 [Melampsora larici-populina 98AG31]EGG03948.1 hypothetical protein MELLADRAFT_65245 [Melampsora larici-populina 98AG31]